MKCRSCALVRPIDRFNVIALSSGDALAFCSDDDVCRLEEFAIKIGMKDTPVSVVHETQPLSLEAEERLLTRILG